ncbi:hypothetical protein M752DRAFT_26525 [Aspergillus phoenicis ATCC 13157]|uniref:Uncharacterized protein n=1 Tax=Aspergillus phoenicis ATCC 13157 TaxID=1353007 RepID=A0A370PH17_ASPPH|nr:hypothetical protein M752DRAFT_26525 [Aspergillus phoenicis ATCC 13157]
MAWRKERARKKKRRADLRGWKASDWLFTSHDGAGMVLVGAAAVMMTMTIGIPACYISSEDVYVVERTNTGYEIIG